MSENGYVDNELFISEELFEEYSKTRVPKENDIMITAVGTLGKTYIVTKNDRFYYKDASVICFENFSNISSQYIQFLMLSPYMENLIKSKSSGTTVGTITISNANEYLIPIPPLNEQTKIVTELKRIFKHCEKL